MKRIYYILFLVTLLFSCEKPISEFQSQNFIKLFGSGFESKGNDVIELADGGYVITGYDQISGEGNQIFAAKVDLNGNLIWSKTYGSSDSNEEGKVVKKIDDGLLFAGTSLGSSGITHSFLMKTNEEGELGWYKEFGDPLYSIVVNDIFVNDSNVYVAGLSQSDPQNVNKTEYYSAKLILSEDTAIKVKLKWKVNTPFAFNCSLEQVFLNGDNLLFFGTDSEQNKIIIVTLAQSDGGVSNFENSETPDGTAIDVSFSQDQIFILANNLSGTQLSKLNPSHIIDWQTELIASVSGKAVAYNEDGTLMLCGESIKDGNSLINFIKVDKTGSAQYGPQFFRTLQGTVGKVFQTKDKGLILVGTTNPTFGASVQLIKTDKDFFMLKN